MTCHAARRDLPTLPPSVQTVYCQLHTHDPMTGKQIREATGLPRRTVYSALLALQELGVLQKQQSLRDTRQTYFWVPAGARSEQPRQNA